MSSFRKKMTGILLGIAVFLGLCFNSEAADPPVKVRLVGAQNITGKPWRGRVEIYRNGQWGTVCDDVWDMNDVNVLCRELGFSRGRLPYCCARFGEGNETQPIFLAEVHCQGNEKSIAECRNTGWGPHPNCEHDEDAGVECLRSTKIVKNGNCSFDENNCGYTQDTNDVFNWTLRTGRTASYGTGPPYDHTLQTNAGFYMYIETSDPRKYEDTARLVSPPISGKTCLEFYYYMWGIHINELRVYKNSGKGETLIWHLYGDQGRGWKGARVPIDKSTFQIVFEGVAGARYKGDIAIDDIVVSNSNNCSSEIPAVAKPKNKKPVKEIRLVGAKVKNAGRVEVYHYTGKKDGTWGTICGDYDFDIKDADVICRSLHYPGADMALRTPVFGPGQNMKIWLSNLRCTGQEASIGTCPHRGWGLTSCSHYQDASVICKTNITALTDFELRLNGTKSNDFEGRVELLIGGIWGTIRSTNWDIFDANVACRQLKHAGAYGVFHSSAAYGLGNGPQWLSNFGCFGNETRLSQCNHTFRTSHNWWNHFSDAGAKCYDLRLVGGKTKLEGRVELKYEGVWGTICSKDWDIRDANVVCRELGYTRAIANATAKTFGSGSGRIILDGLECKGDESSLSLCRSRGWGIARPDCSHALDVGVSCEIVKDNPACDKKKCPAQSVCRVRAKKAFCLCTTTTAVTGCDIPVGTSVISILLSETSDQWNQNKSVNDIVTALNTYCSGSSSKCGFNSATKKLSPNDVVFTKDPSFFGGQLVMEVIAFVPATQTVLSKEVITSAIRNKGSLGGYQIKLVNGKVLATHKHKRNNNLAAIGVGVAVAVIAVIGLVALVAFLVKRQIVQGRMRSVVSRSQSGRGIGDHAYSQLAVDDDENFDPDAPLLIPPADNQATEQQS